MPGSPEAIAFIKKYQLDCEVFAPQNLILATLDPEIGFPSLYFEDESGNTGRIRQAHHSGDKPIFEFQRSERVIIEMDEKDLTSLKGMAPIAAGLQKDASRAKLPPRTYRLLRKTGSEDSVEYYPSATELPETCKLFEFVFREKDNPRGHKSKGFVTNIHDPKIQEDCLVQNIKAIEKAGGSGINVMIAASNIFIARQGSYDIISSYQKKALCKEITEALDIRAMQSINEPKKPARAGGVSRFCCLPLRRSNKIKSDELT